MALSTSKELAAIVISKAWATMIDVTEESVRVMSAPQPSQWESEGGMAVM